MWFGCSPNVLPVDAKDGWDFSVKSTTTIESYMKEAHFFRQFNIAWIFYWEYCFHQPPFHYPLFAFTK